MLVRSHAPTHRLADEMPRICAMLEFMIRVNYRTIFQPLCLVSKDGRLNGEGFWKAGFRPEGSWTMFSEQSLGSRNPCSEMCSADMEGFGGARYVEG